MVRRALFTLVLTAFASTALAAGPARWLQLVVHLDNSGPYTLDDELELEVEVINRGGAPIVFWNMLEWDHTLRYSVQGPHVRGWDMIQDTFEPPPPLAPTIVLAPGESVTRRATFTVDGLVNGPGRFVLAVQYMAPAEATLVGQPHSAWTRMSGAIVGAAEFEVVEP